MRIHFYILRTQFQIIDRMEILMELMIMSRSVLHRGGTKSSENIAGFVQEQNGWRQSIRNCYVAGTVYGLNDVSGFIGKAQSDLTVENCYANVLIDAGGNVGGFASETFNTNTKLTNCHALGVIRNAKGQVGLFARSMMVR